MSLFGGVSRPKGITKEELHHVKAELGSASLGHGTEKLTERQIDEIVHRLELCLDPDNSEERRNNFGQADQSEVNMIEEQIINDDALHFTETQKAHAKKVLQKYIDINRHDGMFTI